MDQLWSPWRSEYIQTADHYSEDQCFLCSCSSSGVSADTLVVAEFPNTFVVLNKYPYNAGHLLIAPKIHHAELATLDSKISIEMMQVLQISLRVTETILKPHGCNIGANLGRAAGAGVPHHLHLHIVPRWNGDTNFMPTVGDVKVVSESVAKLWKQFSDAFYGAEVEGG